MTPTVASSVGVPPTSFETAPKPNSKIKTKVLGKAKRTNAKSGGTSVKVKMNRPSKSRLITPLQQNFLKMH